MKKLVRQISGWSLIVLGIVSGLIPILQGWVFILAGLALLAKDSAWAHRALEKLKERFKKKPSKN